ncbi:hypothetical protein WM34_15375 [Burkholderia ubonensis]|uniref:hypothetical protein n=1 Tax=Burkholderia ubonensis TaxID=101571 RepID=UPI0007566714|nr:hypothetical protein [Burkholderia ubonensis]KWD11438.1 hypothetical protein WL59_33185 [Burkholderia ubonensis]KWD20653.1 hypothetical protein WL60_03065 [Burkholderia ubonensis]KWO94120.1 hypothetical protein WM34_15375 [Burkholderia ubonensis]
MTTKTMAERTMQALGMLALAGCAAQGGTPGAYDAAKDARIRAYWGPVVYFHFNRACRPPESVLTGYPDTIVATKPGLSALVNKTVGMPVPDDAAKYFHEYVVPAGKPVTITSESNYQDFRNGKVVRVTEAPVSGTFVPAAGHDYEVRGSAGSAPNHLTLRELRVDNGRVTTTPVPIAPAPACE